MVRNIMNALSMYIRIGAVAFTLVVALLNPAATHAQGDPRSNVNLIGMTPDPADFPDLRYRQQNEPACAIRPDDSACIICAYNDYRGVDLDIGFGDSWQGVSQSCDAGDTWRSRLAPGYPGDLDAQNLPAEFAADPRLAAIPGMAIFNFIAGFRYSNVGVLAIQHWLEVNKEDADHYEPGKVTYFADEGTSGRFLDKPDMLAVLDLASQQSTIWLDTVMENGELGNNGVITREFPTGTLYVAYAVFTGSNSVKVLVKTSRDWGRTWKNQAIKLSEDQNQVSGITLTAIGNKVLAVWRRQGDGNDPDSIMYSIITNGGKKATKGEVLADICAFDQPTLTGSETDFDIVTFRTNDFPWVANDGENVFAFYSERERDQAGMCLVDDEGNPNGKPRIVMQHSTLSGQASWTNYGPIDQTATANSFQFMPTAFGANGDVRVAWYDTRRDPSDPFALPFVADYDAGQFLVHRTVDVFTTSITMDNGTPVIPDPVRASQFSILVNEDEEFETEAAFANKKLFAQGDASFLGDYIAIAARQFRKNIADTAWEANASQGPFDNEDFFVAWTDNRDVRGVISQISETTPYSYDAGGTAGTAPELDSDDQSGTDHLLADSPENTGPPRDFSATAEGLDGTDPNTPGFCVPGEDRTRDANIYGSLIKDQARMYAPNPSKPLSGLQRAFPVVITNSDDFAKDYELTIIPGTCPGPCQASFRQEPLFTGAVHAEQVTVEAKSSLARTVFIVGDQTPVKVEARDDTGDLLATIQLANAPQFLDPENCDSSSCTVAENELHNLELKTVDVHLLDLLTPGPSELAALPILSSRPDDVAEEDWEDASSLVAWAVAGDCCEGENPASLGSVIEYAVENLEEETVQIDDVLDNASLLNAALLNASLLNASLLNASLLNASLLNDSLPDTVDPTDLTILNPELVNAAISGGCCFPELEETYGNIVVWAYNNPEYSDPDGINASLLNAALLNASLLNASLLNASLLNASLLNASLLNASLLNASLLNASLLNASLLNTSPEEVDNLLNTDLLNASLLNPTMVALALEGGCCEGVTDPSEAPAVDVIIYAVGHPEVINASLLNASLLNASLLNASLLNASLLNASLLNASLLNANLIEGELSNASLLNASLLNADLINASLLNASLLNASLLNEALDAGETITYDDYTYPITNNGNVTTAIDADIAIHAPMVTTDEGEVQDVIGTKLMTWTANATPTIVDCVERVQLNTRVRTITAPDSSFDVATIEDPFAGQTSTVVAAGETVFVTLRVIGTEEQLKKVRISGFTASSQAANCYQTVNGPQCDDQLIIGVEQITLAQPVITLLGDTPVTIEAGDVYDDAGATAVAGSEDLTTAIVTVNPVNTNVAGSYTVTYNVSTTDGSVAEEVTRTVNVVDTTAPSISLTGANPQVVEVGSAYVELGATAFDPVFGDVSSAITIDASAVDSSTVGSYSVTYNVTDASSNAATQVTRTVNVVDTIAPVITLNGTASVTLEVGVDTYSELGASVSDAGAPSLTEATVGGDAIDSSTVGTYVVTYNANDGYNDAIEVTRTVNVVDTTAPVITLNGTATVTLEVGVDTYTELGAGVSDSGAPSLTDATVGGDTVDTGTVGTYTVRYNANDGYNDAAEITRTVNVVDTTVPVITLLGTTPVTVEVGGSYTDAGATASDIGDGDLTTSIVVGDSVNTAVVGSYTVTYDVTDSSSNAAAQVTRTVNVVDTTAPIITLLGNSPVTVEAGTVYTDAGASAFDIGDGDLSASIVPSSNVNTGAVGTYTVTYNVSDSQGNAAAEVTRTVNVIDTTSPTIGVASPLPENCSDDGSTVNCDFTATSPEGAYVDLSGIVTASDLGQPITTSCTTIAPSTQVGILLPQTLPPGDYTVLCTASDGSSVAVTVQITVDVVDDVAPVLTVPSSAVTAVADPDTGTAIVDYSSEISATDLIDENVTISCDPPSGSVFPVGDTTVTCTASDDGPNAAGNVNTTIETFTVTVSDGTPPSVIADDVELRRDYFDPTDPDWTRLTTTDLTNGVVATDIVDGPISSVSCARDDVPEDPLTTADFEFSDEPYSITCAAVDSAGNEGSASYALTVSYLYDIDLMPPKGRAHAGSTVPLDWTYSDEFGLIDSSEVDVRVAWIRMTDQSCSTPAVDSGSNGVSGIGDDSGNSDFRYSASHDVWQFSWQTPDSPGYFRIVVSPPGANVEEAWACVNLR